MTDKKLKNSTTAGSKKNAAELRKLVAEAFAAANQYNEDAAYDAFEERTRAEGVELLCQLQAFKNVDETIIRALNLLIEYDPPKPISLSDRFFDNLMEVLTYPRCGLYDNWELREDATDAELLALAGAIERRDYNKLEGLRGKCKTSYVIGMNDRDSYIQLLGNLNSLCLTFAHLAKHFDSFAAGNRFLMNSSRLRKVMKCASPYFEAGIADAFIGDFREGLEEIAIAADYSRMPTWAKYRGDFLKRNSAVLKEALANLDNQEAK